MSLWIQMNMKAKWKQIKNKKYKTLNMPFIPHTKHDVESMLADIGVKEISSLFGDIPPSLMINALPGIPPSLSEMQMSRLMNERGKNMSQGKCFIGAGAYEHHLPQAVWDITMRGEFLTNYTPYQAEASQGTLQLLWEYQTMMASLMAQEVSNASLYDGATALAEALLMACRLQKKKQSKLFIPQTLHPYYRQVLKTAFKEQNSELIEIPFDEKQGVITIESLNKCFEDEGECSALVLPFPNFFGRLEAVNELTDWAHSHKALVIGVVNPLAMAFLKPPGLWGNKGADIACGEGQPLGIPLASGGPYFGFLCSRLSSIRQLPGRIVGRTQDTDGKQGFTLTLQAREQHIRREKATSNICTNQGLLVTAATIYMSLLGPHGLKRQAMSCYERTQFFSKQCQANGIKVLFEGSHFHEVVLALPVSAQEVLIKMAEKGISAGFALETEYPALKNALLVCVTETKTDEDIIEYVKVLKEVCSLKNG